MGGEGSALAGTEAAPDPQLDKARASRSLGASSAPGTTTADPTRQPAYADEGEDRAAAARRNIRQGMAGLLEEIPPVELVGPEPVIDWARKAIAQLWTGRNGQGEPLIRAERVYIARGLVRAYAALKELEKGAERAEDGALMYRVVDQPHPWASERPHSVEDLPPFYPGPQAVWRSLASQDPDADQVAPVRRSAGAEVSEEPTAGIRRSVPKLAHTITFRKPDGLDITTDEGKLGVIALVVRAMYPTMDNLLLKWVVLALGTTLSNGSPRFNDQAWLTEFGQKQVGEQITITADERFTIELDLVLMRAPDRVALIGADVYRGSAGMFYIVGAEFAVFLVAITGGAGLGLLASEGGGVVMSSTALGLETATPTFGSLGSEGATSYYLSAQAAYATAAPALHLSMGTTMAYYGTQAASEGRFGEWASGTLTDMAEQYYMLQPTGLFHTPSAPAAREPTVAGDVAATEAATPPVAAATTEETVALPPAAAATEETLVPPPSAATAEQTAPVAVEPPVEVAKPARPPDLKAKAQAGERMLERAERRLQNAIGDEKNAQRVAAAQDRVGRVQAEIEARQQAGKGPTKALQSKVDRAGTRLGDAQAKQAAAIETAQNKVDAARQVAETRTAAYERAKADAAQRAAQRAANRTEHERLVKMWNDARPEIRKEFARTEIEARQAGTSSAPLTQAEYDAQLEAEAQSAQPPIDKLGRIDWPDRVEGVDRLPPGAVQELDPVKGMTDAELADVAQTGKLPDRWKGLFELEHRIPQRAGGWLAKAGIPPDEASALTKQTDLGNLEPVPPSYHATVDEYRAQFNKGRDVGDPMSSLDTRVQRPFEGATDEELADIVAALKEYDANLELPVQLGTRHVTLGDVLRDEMAKRPAFRGQGL
jgi:hypothetical protein